MRQNVRDFPIGGGRPLGFLPPDVETLPDTRHGIAANLVAVQRNVVLVLLVPLLDGFGLLLGGVYENLARV
jgi:hypothetical protein